MRPATIESQLAAMAAAADRTNKPTALIAGAAVLLVLAVVFTAWSAGRFFTSRQRLVAEMEKRERVEMVLRSIASKQLDLPNLELHYGREALTYMAENINDVAKQVWASADNPNAPIPVNVGAKAGPTKLLTNESLGLSRVDVRMLSPQPLEKIMAFIEGVQNNERLRRVNVSLVKLDPAPTGWNAQLQFTAYEQLPTAGR